LFLSQSPNEFKDIFFQDYYLVFFNQVFSVIRVETFGYQRDPNEWRLFSDTSRVSLKAVILRNRNKFPSVLLARAANMKGSYENIKLFLEKIHNEK
jgi:hypothetical protein